MRRRRGLGRVGVILSLVVLCLVLGEAGARGVDGNSSHKIMHCIRLRS